MVFDASKRRLTCCGLAFLAICAGDRRMALADVKLPAIFGDHMVLQREQQDKVWGWAEPGEGVTVPIEDNSKPTTAGPDGSWSVMLDPMPAGGPHKLTI